MVGRISSSNILNPLSLRKTCNGVCFALFQVGLAVGEVTSVIEKARITTIKQRVSQPLFIGKMSSLQTHVRNCSPLQIDLVLNLEEHLPECIHRQVIQKEPIAVHPNTIPSACYCIRVVVQFFCVCCSAIFFNTNHFRYWTFIFNPRARTPDKKFEEITRIVEKARFNSSEEACLKDVGTCVCVHVYVCRVYRVTYVA